MKVAAAQFATTNDVAANLIKCVSIVAEAAKKQPDLIVLPEFCNHNSWYDNAEHCYQVSVDLEGEFLAAIAQAAQQAGAYVVINCTVRRPDNKVTGTSLLYSPTGELLAQADKQVLIGHENDFLQRATQPGPIVDTPFGKLALYACMDGVINETPRCLALRGAQLLCNSLNSFAIDEGNLHIPVRAAENKVFVIAANKVGPLIPEVMLEPVSAAINIPVQFLSGAGDSQIVAPDGTVLAIAGHTEEIIYAEIDLSQATDKNRPDGTDVFADRRIDLYQPLVQDPAEQKLPAFTGADSIIAAAASVTGSGALAIASAVAAVESLQADKARLICLPELCAVSTDMSVGEAAETSAALVKELQKVLLADTYIATTIIDTEQGASHLAVLISQQGIVYQQGQVHRSQRHSGLTQANSFKVCHTAHGKVAVLCEDDAIYPESFRLLALQGVEIVLVPLALQELWLVSTGLVERAAENRINLIAADRHCANNLICSLQQDFTLMTQWQTRQFDGLLSAPDIVRQPDSALLIATIHPRAAANKVCSHRTDLLANRPWQFMQPVVSPSHPEGTRT